MPGDTENARVYEFGEFRLDSTVLQFRQAIVPLTPKAVDTLYFLVSRSPAVAGKDEIMNAVWPGTFVVESSLARNISLIRKALEDQCGPGPYIETIPKRGYRFVAPLKSGDQVPEAPPPEVPPAAAPLPPVRSLRQWLPAIAAALLLAGGGAWYFRPVARPPEVNPVALIGWHLFYQATPDEARRALALFEKAIAAHPESAILHAGLSEILLQLPLLASGDPDAFTRAKMEAETAVRLDSELSAAHSALGAARMLTDWDFAGAEESLRTSLRLDPGSVTAMIHLSQLLNATGRFDEALATAQRAVKVDPVNPLAGVQAGIVLYGMQRFEDAARQFRDVLDRERNFALAHYYLALTCGYLGSFDEAIRHLEMAELHPEVLRTDRAWLKARRGDPAQAELIYAELLNLSRAGKVSSAAPLLLAVVLGRVDEAFAHLNAGVRDRAPEITGLQSDPRLSALRTDPRFASVVRQIGLAGSRVNR